MNKPVKGRAGCAICRETITAYNMAIFADDHEAAAEALDSYIDHRQSDVKHRQGGHSYIELCRDVLSLVPNRSIVPAF